MQTIETHLDCVLFVNTLTLLKSIGWRRTGSSPFMVIDRNGGPQNPVQAVANFLGLENAPVDSELTPEFVDDQVFAKFET